MVGAARGRLKSALRDRAAVGLHKGHGASVNVRNGQPSHPNEKVPIQDGTQQLMDYAMEEEALAQGLGEGNGWLVQTIQIVTARHNSSSPVKMLY